MIARLAGLTGGFIVLVLLLTLAVTNRHAVTLVLDPFTPDDPVVALSLPFYVYLLSMMIVGVVAGGAATWMNQAKFRRLARTKTQEALRWRGEAERLTRERDAGVSQRKELALAKR